MLGPLREYQRPTSFAHGGHDVGAEQAVPGLITSKCFVKPMKFCAWVRRRFRGSAKSSWAHHYLMAKRARGGLLLRIDAIIAPAHIP